MTCVCVCSTETKVSHAFTTKQAKKNPESLFLCIQFTVFPHRLHSRNEIVAL